MTFFEGILIANLLTLLWASYKIGKLNSDIDIIYEGMASVITDIEKLQNKQNQKGPTQVNSYVGLLCI